MIRIQALAPFRYQYQQKIVWLTSGESMYLDASDSTQRDELKYILSSRFAFKEYIYINLSAVESALKQEVGEDDGFYAIENHYPLPEEVCPTVPASFTAPYQEPTDSPFLHPVMSAITPDRAIIDSSTKGIVEECLLPNTPIETCPEEACDLEAIKKESRKKELMYTSSNKIKGIAATYGIDYTNKAETVTKILNLEFGQE